MTKNEFIEILESKNYKYSVEEEGHVIVTSDNVYLDLSDLYEIPSNVKFRNQGSLNLRNLKSVPNGVRFRCGYGNTNGGYSQLDLSSVEEISEGMKFDNGGTLILSSLKKIPDNVKFDCGSIDLPGLKEIGNNVIFVVNSDIRINGIEEMTTNVIFKGNSKKSGVFLSKLEKISNNVIFIHSGAVYIGADFNPPYGYTFKNKGLLIFLRYPKKINMVKGQIKLESSENKFPLVGTKNEFQKSDDILSDLERAYGILEYSSIRFNPYNPILGEVLNNYLYELINK
jgi:hypothetical protein